MCRFQRNMLERFGNSTSQRSHQVRLHHEKRGHHKSASALHVHRISTEPVERGARMVQILSARHRNNLVITDVASNEATY